MLPHARRQREAAVNAGPFSPRVNVGRMGTMTIQPLTDAQVRGKRVLLRAGFDVPLEKGEVNDTSRLEALKPTMTWIIENGGRLILLAHQGRPKGKPVPEFSQRPLVAPLEKILGRSVAFCEHTTGPEAQKAAQALKDGEVLLLENLRYDPREEKDDESFAAELAVMGDLYVNDAFTNCHRAHASVSALAKKLPAYAGLNLLEELKHLTPAVEDPRRPLLLVISGAKMETKVPVIRRFLELADDIIIGGAIANTFLAARGFDVGASLHEPDQVELCQAIMLESEQPGRAVLHLPRDVVVGSADAGEQPVALDLPVEDVEGDMSIGDIGAVTAARHADLVAKAGTVIWNGPLGRYEIEAFSKGSLALVDALAASKAITVIGGGDTLDLHERYHKDLNAYGFVSTAGGAMLEFLAGEKLPGLLALEASPR